jgi:predicted Zn-dependent protease
MTETELAAAFADSPRRQEIRFLLRTTKLLLGRPPREAIRLLETAIGAAPNVSEGWWRLALVYRSAGQTEKARQVIADARSRGVAFQPAEEQWVREAFREATE